MYLSKTETKQLELLKKKGPVERFILMTQLISGQFEFMKAGLRYTNSELDDEGFKQCLKDKMIKIYTLEH